jgi:hypothetical protein
VGAPQDRGHHRFRWWSAGAGDRERRDQYPEVIIGFPNASVS